ncbi:hypothetical protein V2W45_1247634 [Cenococcum geophilum]
MVHADILATPGAQPSKPLPRFQWPNGGTGRSPRYQPSGSSSRQGRDKHVFRSGFDHANVYHSLDYLWTALTGWKLCENGADGKIRVAGIGMFHQLHCLNRSRSVIQQLQASKRIGYSGHWPHWFDYLRSVILCN